MAPPSHFPTLYFLVIFLQPDQIEVNMQGGPDKHVQSWEKNKFLSPGIQQQLPPETVGCAA